MPVPSTLPRTDAQLFENYIGGKWCASSDGRTFEHRNPADLEAITGLWPQSPRADARKAIDAAARAFPRWSGLTVYERAAVLKKALAAMEQRREEIAGVITLENGKTLAESRTEVDAAIREMEFQIHQGLRALGTTMPSAAPQVFAYSTRRPLGVVSVISPWNFPFNVPGRKCTPALIAGNTVVFKPASLTPRTGQMFVRLFVDAGMPDGVINFITGGGSTVGEELTTNSTIRAISFTGSTGVGKQLQSKAGANLIRTQLELGGKNPMVVLEDADLERAAADAALAAFACAGQWCTSTSRLIVVDSIADEMVERLVSVAKAHVLGPGADARSTMGPVCGSDQLASILQYIDIGRAEGAIVAAGGSRMSSDGLGAGCFIAPTIFTGVTPVMRIAREEIFGPVLSIIRVKDFDEAIDVANGVEFGLASSIYTNDFSRALTFLERTDVGLTHVNMLTAYKEPQLTFGGVKASGFGIPEAGESGIEFFTEHKVAYLRYGRPRA